MSKPLITIECSSSINDAIKIMNDKNIRRLVVVNRHNNMVGILTQKDVFKVINKSAHLFTEFYGDNFPARLDQIYQRFTQYKFDNLSPGFTNLPE
ncbi:MAG: CBS domain-containing protein [Nitrososphaeraceae archaeon]